MGNTAGHGRVEGGVPLALGYLSEVTTLLLLVFVGQRQRSSLRVDSLGCAVLPLEGLS